METLQVYFVRIEISGERKSLFVAVPINMTEQEIKNKLVAHFTDNVPFATVYSLEISKESKEVLVIN